ALIPARGPARRIEGPTVAGRGLARRGIVGPPGLVAPRRAGGRVAIGPAGRRADGAIGVGVIRPRAGVLRTAVLAVHAGAGRAAAGVTHVPGRIVGAPSPAIHHGGGGDPHREAERGADRRVVDRLGHHAICNRWGVPDRAHPRLVD